MSNVDDEVRKVTRSIQFDVGLSEALVQAATDRGVSTNWLVNQLCKEGLKRLVEDIRVTT